MNTRRRGAISRLARPCDGGFGGVVAFLLGLTLLAPAAAAADAAGVTPAVLPECRFLSLGADGAEQRPEMSEETLKRLFGVLSKTPIGRLVVESLDKYHRQGVGGDSGRRLVQFEFELPDLGTRGSEDLYAGRSAGGDSDRRFAGRSVRRQNQTELAPDWRIRSKPTREISRP